MKKVLSLVLSICMLFSITSGIDFSAFATTYTGKCGTNASYSMNTSTGLLKITGSGIVENEWTDNDNKFLDSIKTISVGNGITELGSGAFGYCRNTVSITLPSTLTKIGFEAFANCESLQSISIPNSVTYIGGGAFLECHNIKTLNIPVNVSFIGTEAFEDMYNLETVNWNAENAKLEYNCYYTRLFSFSGKNVEGGTTLNFTESCKYLEYGRYLLNDLNCYISTININKDLHGSLSLGSKNIEQTVNFYSCATIDEENDRYTENNISFTFNASSKKVHMNVLNGSNSLPVVHSEDLPYVDMNIQNPSGIEIICYTQFSNYTSDNYNQFLGSYKLENVKYIAGNSFNGSEIDFIPQNAEYIGSDAFCRCKKLTTISLSKNLKTISETAFAFCTNLTDVYYAGTRAEWDNVYISTKSYGDGSNNNYLLDAIIHCSDDPEDDTVKPVCSLTSTNNISSGQTVTISLSDNSGIAGYYWGTNSNYLNNTYTATKSTSITKTITSAGTYYLTAKDICGNVSDTVSVTFFKTTLNANNGSVSPSSVLTKSGSSFTFPTPTRSGYLYQGWNVSSSAANGIKTLTPNSNATYYAIWELDFVDTTLPEGKIVSVTNNIATSQQVTLELSDNYRIAGYYWGRSIDYAGNKYYSVNSTETTVRETVTVSIADTYFLTVVDKKNNTSATVSVTFDKLTLNPEGGVVTPEYLIIQRGNSVVLPKPVRSGYKFKGWRYTSDPAYLTDTWKSTENYSLFAEWELSADNTAPTASVSATNNVAASQTATLSMNDNVGIVGYYWGTNSNYTNNNYTTSTNTSVTKTVSDAGTYYLTAKDTSGNVSSTVSITFYKTTLNANGGTVSPASVLTKSGNSFTFPTPTRSGNTYQGWNTSSSAASGVKTLTPTSNTTYYAVWKASTGSLSVSELTYSFSNSNEGFGYPDDYRIPLSSFQLIFGNTEIAKELYRREGTWGGNCFGMSTTSTLFTINSNVKISQFNSNASKISGLSLNDVSSVRNIKLRQFIEAMQTSQYAPEIYTNYVTNNLVKLVKVVKDISNTGQPVPVGVMGNIGGHEILAYGYKTVSSTKSQILVYDNNYPNQERYINITTNTSGTPTAWSYTLWDGCTMSSNNGSSIDYILPKYCESVWKNGSKGNSNTLIVNTENLNIYDVNDNIVATIKNGKVTNSTSQNVFVIPNHGLKLNDENSSSSIAIGLPVDYYTIKNTDSSVKTITATMVDSDRSASIETNSATIEFCVSDEEAIQNVSMPATTGKTYSIQLNSTAPNDNENVSVEGVTTGTTIVATQLGGSISLNNCKGATISINDQDISFSSGKKYIDDCTMTISNTSIQCTGRAVSPSIVIKDFEKTLVEGTDYVCIYSDNIGTGNASVTVYGIGDYYGSAMRKFTIYCNHKYSTVVTKKATPTATGVKTYTCTVCGAKKTQVIPKCAKYKNTLTAKGKTATVKYSKLKKKNQTVALKKTITVSNAKGTVTYKKSSGNKKITINKKTGKITVKKGLKKGTYKVKIKVTAAGNASYAKVTKTITVTIKVK